MMGKLFPCAMCKQRLPMESFYQSPSRSTGVSSRCISCAKKERAMWWAENKDKPDVRAADRARSLKYVRLHPETGVLWRQQNRKHLNRYANEWRRTSSYVGRRKGDSRTIRVTPDWANRFFIGEIYALARLRTKLMGVPWEVDHIIPLNGVEVCGLHVENNLRVVPRVINRAKRNNFSHEVMP